VYLHVVDRLFKQNQFVRGEYVALGKKLSLRDVRCPAYLLAGKDDDIILGAYFQRGNGVGHTRGELADN
jgi:poly(3-hydroxyalkanoate) synthetase